MGDLTMYVVPKGYNIQKSVYAIDADFSLSQDQHKKTEKHKETEKDKGAEEDTKETKGAVPEPEVVPSLPVAQEADLEAGQHKKTEKDMETEVDKETREDIGPWTPGLVRYAAMLLVVADWEKQHEFVECAGATPSEKLAHFKKGMARHGVTEVNVVDENPVSYFGINSSSLVLDDNGSPEHPG